MLPTGIALITAERERQITQERHSTDYDDQQSPFALSTAGACYALDLVKETALYASWFGATYTVNNAVISLWPFDEEWWKPTPNDPIRQLTKAGALIAAEIDRLQRLKGKERC